MDDDLNNDTFDMFKTPQIKTRNICLRKPKRSLNNSYRIDTEPSTSNKKPNNTQTHLNLVSKFLPHHNSVKHFNTLDSSKLLNKTYDLGNDIKKKDINKNLNIKKENSVIQTMSHKRTKTDINKKTNKFEVKDDAKKLKTKNKNLDNKNINEDETNKIDNNEHKNNNVNENKVNGTNKKEENTKDIKNKEKLSNNKTKKDLNKSDNKNKIKKENNKEENDKKNKEEKNNKKNLEIKKENKVKSLKNNKKNETKGNSKKYNTINTSNASNLSNTLNDEKKMKDKKKNLKLNCLNVIPLPSRKSVSPKNISHHLPFDKNLLDPKKEYIFSPKITNRVISFEKFRSKEETKKI